MKKYFVTAIILLFSAPAVSLAAPLTQTQAESLINVVQASPSTPASAFTDLITAFSNITLAQAESLIGVVQAAPGVPATSFVNLLIAFTQDTQAVATTSTNTQTTTTTSSERQCPQYSTGTYPNCSNTSTSVNTSNTVPTSTTTVTPTENGGTVSVYFDNSQKNSPVPQPISDPPITPTYFGTVVVYNGSTQQNIIKVSSIPLELSVGGGGVPTDLKDCALLINSSLPLNTGSRTVNPSSTGEIKFSLDNALGVESGVIEPISIYCAVMNTAPTGGTYTWSTNGNDAPSFLWNTEYGGQGVNNTATLNFETNSGITYQK
jgi:hypothetical protein